jgi:N-acetylglucosamine kinase-like BadF-type ATPase
MILIADSGSTKTDWRLIDDDKKILNFATKGLNPFFKTSLEIEEEVRLRIKDKFSPQRVQKIFFYGAGCSIRNKNKVVGKALKNIFCNSTMDINSDLTGAAHALFQHDAGLVVILGTGTNTGYYDGKRIVRSIIPLGYIFGDEGSGAVLGLKFIQAYLKEELPTKIRQRFYEKYKLSTEDIKEAVYSRSLPNQFLASFNPFLAEYLDEPSVYQIVYVSMEELFERQIRKYENWTEMPVRCTGSVAHIFRSVLLRVASDWNTKIDKIIRSPIDGLVKYHLKNPL